MTPRRTAAILVIALGGLTGGYRSAGAATPSTGVIVPPSSQSASTLPPLTVPSPTLPPVTVPPAAQPVLALVSPTVSPVCGDVGLLTVLVPYATGVPIPASANLATAPVFEVCGAVPMPNGGYQCTADQAVLNAIASAEQSGAATSIPLVPPPEGTVVDETFLIAEEVSPATAKTVDPSISAVLQCASTSPSSSAPPKTPAGLPVSSASTNPTIPPAPSGPSLTPVTTITSSTGAPSVDQASSVGLPAANPALAQAPPTTSRAPAGSVLIGYLRPHFPTALLVLVLTLIAGVVYGGRNLVAPISLPSERTPPES